MNRSQSIQWQGGHPRDLASATKCVHLAIERHIPIAQQQVQPHIMAADQKPVLVTIVTSPPRSIFTCLSQEHKQAALAGVPLEISQQIKQIEVSTDVCRLCPFWQTKEPSALLEMPS